MRRVLSIQQQDFDVARLQQELVAEEPEMGAVVSFTGYVRGRSGDREVSSMELEHYPGMTERSIEGIIDQAAARWPLLGVTVVHRVGVLTPGSRIVYVGVGSSHRGSAFAAAEYIMDFLKTGAPFWKKETGPTGACWVEARNSDETAARRWRD
ncbi:MAG: molybdopterin synthase catalytic subunit MoaE [Halieaceae bacterium]|nr:molybdopterin synthase catalytic subunit MoaE [Halieaceae bacterium]